MGQLIGRFTDGDGVDLALDLDDRVLAFVDVHGLSDLRILNDDVFVADLVFL